MNFAGMSADALEKLARDASELATALRAAQPNYAVALANGIRDRSYSTVRWGRVADYSGEAIITMADGRRWRAVGHGPEGGAEMISRHGWIEFQPL